MSYANIMIDLETLGNRSGCVILSIGAVMIDLAAGTLGPEFYSPIRVLSSTEVGMHIDPNTIAWWDKQSPEARKVLDDAYASEAPPLPLVLRAFGGFLQAHMNCQFDERCLWGNGASFDAPILTEAYRLCGVKRPWPYWGDMCFRTVSKLNRHISMARSGVQHNALDDARQQARHLIKILQQNKGA